MTGVQNALEVVNLTKRYGAMAAVKDLTFHVEPNEILGISGPNGAGKTTLFDVISGLSAASAGRVTLFGQDITGARAEQVCHLGLARTFQLNAVFDSMTVEENLLTAAYFGRHGRSFPGLRFDRQSHADCDAALEITGLAPHRHRPAAQLTVLERKLLMLASAVATGPRLLMLDEPVGGLTREEIDHCAGVIRRIRAERAMTIVLIEHVMSFVTALADRVMVLHHGAKLYEGSVAGMAESAEVVSAYLGTSGLRDLKQAAETGNGGGHDDAA
ncbi:ABC transporter ATP-binding protein [Ruixingdingia sedimenti]|uniref:ABC transporter ATP-binding protein n=1 Tax=Ruixingdingia sedimenti TaxID=3073604 RepID=A0ABU1FEB9_9RHOB|nr:ABC transporter ATP-binding protein [Xinfangfangia sp. LG-4]MDR5655211.1 ABC transporter ATP-binding protein [Xinfangfangia sp. LG-4]